MTVVPPAPAAARSWCPTCREHTVLDVGRSCAWCDTTTVEAQRPKKRTGVKPLLSDDQVRLLHKAHTSGLSVRELGRRIYAKGFYGSEHSAMEGIRAGFTRLGLPARDRVEATVAASTTHGLRPRSGAKPGYNDVRKARRRENGEVHGRICAGIRVQPPRKGAPCRLAALADSDYCHGHDPRYASARADHLARSRELIGARP